MPGLGCYRVLSAGACRALGSAPLQPQHTTAPQWTELTLYDAGVGSLCLSSSQGAKETVVQAREALIRAMGDGKTLLDVRRPV